MKTKEEVEILSCDKCGREENSIHHAPHVFIVTCAVCGKDVCQGTGYNCSFLWSDEDMRNIYICFSHVDDLIKKAKNDNNKNSIQD